MQFTSRPRIARGLPWFLTLALGLAVAPLALADETPDPVDPLEDQALEEEARANFEQSLETFRQAFGKAVEGATGEKRRRNLARAEVLLEKMAGLTNQTSSHRESAEFLAGYSEEQLGPVLHALVGWERAQHLLATGDEAQATAVLQALGFVRDWWITGPFDNERGRGFDQAADPESGIDLDATYKGKERDVTWRQVPVVTRSGYVDLDAMLRPNDQALAYGVAFVKADAPGAAALRLGSDEAVKVWWNGRETLAKKARRTIDFDQDVVPVHLNAGWNVLLVKVGDQTGAWGYRVRLTAADGSTLGGLTWATTREQADEALAAGATWTDPDLAVADGGRGYYDDLVESDEATARELFHLGYLHMTRGYDNIADRQASTFLRKATDAEPGNPVYRFHYAEAAAPPTKMAVEKEENRQRIAREEAIAMNPEYAVAYRALAAYYTNSLVNLEQAERLLRRALEVQPDFVEARLDLARVLDRRGLDAQAELIREEIFADPRYAGHEQVQAARANALGRDGRRSEARATWQQVLDIDARTRRARSQIAELAAMALERDDAMAVLESLRELDPYDIGSLRRQAELLEGAGEYAAALAKLDQALTIAPEDDDLLVRVGRIHLRNGDRETGLDALREALRINPKNQDLERYVQYLDPEEAPFEDAFVADLAPFIEKAKAYDNSENDPWLTLLDHTVTKVNLDGTSSSYIRQAHKILSPLGTQRWQREFAQAYRGQSLKWKHAKLIKPDGSEIEAKRRGRIVQFPAPQVGDIVDFAYRVDDQQQSFFGDYFGTVNYFASDVPMLSSEFTLITPTDGKFFVHQRNLDITPEVRTEEDGTTVRTWTRMDAEKVRSEPGMPWAREMYPLVQVSTFEDWDAFAIWYWNLIEDQHIASPDIKAKVAELVEGKETRREKIRAIYEFVTGEITYQAWSFGVHGYQPYTTTAIFDKREGDCKDKAILLKTMLAEIGVESYPVLIWAATNSGVASGGGPRGEEDLTLPMVNHFNHCIAYVPDVDGEGTPAYLDGTAQYASMDVAPQMDRGATVLIVKPDGGDVQQIPVGAAEDLALEQEWRVEVGEDGGAIATGRFAFRGDLATQARSWFSVEGRRPFILQQILTQVFGQAKLLEQEFDDLTDLSEPVVNFTVKAEVSGFATADGDGYSLKTEFFEILFGVDQLVSRPEREHDIVFGSPFRMHSRIEYVLPEGWTSVAPPKALDLTAGPVDFDVRAEVGADSLVLERTVVLSDTRVEAEAYPEFRAGVNEALSIRQQRWKVKPGN